jgi:DNA (cytosine-5)-methyltransferase 1
MNHLGLFEGIGGFMLAARWMNWNTIAWVEKDKSCQNVLKKHFPNSIGHADIFEFSGAEYRGRIDIVTGGFPCTPFSHAGQRDGTDDERYLWPEMLRVVTEIQPRWVVAENVYGLLTIDRGFTVESICSDLESAGYERPIVLDTASDTFGLSTMERHIWIISEATSQRRERIQEDKDQDNRNERQFSGANPGIIDRWDIRATKFRGVGERVSARLDKGERERLKQLGNAVPPYAVYQIFKAIDASMNLPQHQSTPKR